MPSEFLKEALVECDIRSGYREMIGFKICEFPPVYHGGGVESRVNQ